MERLLELMNEYAHTYADHYDDTGEEITITFFSHGDQCFQYVCDGKYETLVDDTVISKRFGFIKRLVDNDRIDTDIVYKKWFLAKTYDKDEVWECFEPYEEILMLLAISDTPIDLLCSLLNNENIYIKTNRSKSWTI